jgi:hypothetical protein
MLKKRIWLLKEFLLRIRLAYPDPVRDPSFNINNFNNDLNIVNIDYKT